jgi:hypothetical protein
MKGPVPYGLNIFIKIILWCVILIAEFQIRPLLQSGSLLKML